ncbi:MAG: peptidylprolyl isomerase, partial [Nanoarchaeota archaeon]|nr:peptidylprolyl isomerase [Nanoarchaeota archaeon]
LISALKKRSLRKKQKEKEKEKKMPAKEVKKSKPEIKKYKPAYSESRSNHEEKGDRKVKSNSHNGQKEGKSKDNKLNRNLIAFFITAAVFVLILIFIFKVGQQDRSAVIATVNGQAITQAFFDGQFNTFVFVQNIPEEMRASVDKDEYLAILITETLMQEEAVKKGIALSDEGFESEFKNMLDNSPYTEASLKVTLEQNSIKSDEYKTFMRRAIDSGKLLQWATENYTPNETSLIQLYNELYETRYASHILVCYEGSLTCKNSLSEQDAITKANQAMALAKINFSDAVLQFSDDIQTKQKGGVLGLVKRGQTVKEFEEKLFSMTEGEISAPIKTSYGLHIIKLHKITPTYDEVKDQVKLSLYKSELKEKTKVEFFVDTLNVVAPKSPLVQCIEKNGAMPESVVFYYSSKCGPICDEMFAQTKTLKALGYQFYYSEISEKSWLEIMDCFENKQKGIPQLICAGTGEVMLGKVDSAKIRAFADKCRADASSSSSSK